MKNIVLTFRKLRDEKVWLSNTAATIFLEKKYFKNGTQNVCQARQQHLAIEAPVEPVED